MWDTVFPYLAALLPTVAVSVLFYFIIKYILEGDRRERLAQSKWERDHTDAPTAESASPQKRQHSADE